MAHFILHTQTAAKGPFVNPQYNITVMSEGFHGPPNSAPTMVRGAAFQTGCIHTGYGIFFCRMKLILILFTIMLCI